ncbi:MAG: DsbA family protein [Pseudomonadota bacterium]
MMIRYFLSATALGALAMTSACSQPSSSQLNKEEVEEIVRAYILENPEIIEEAVIELQRRRAEADALAKKEAIEEHETRIKDDPRDYSIGPDDAPVTIVEFFDYRCGPCRASMDWVTSLPEKYDGKVRVVFKEFPVIAPQSRDAALATLAAGRQGKYLEMHQALMRDPSDMSASDIETIAKRVGLNLDKLRADMESFEIQKHISDNYQLAEDIGAGATPTFIVGDDFSEGLNRLRLEAKISELLSKAG